MAPEHRSDVIGMTVMASVEGDDDDDAVAVWHCYRTYPKDRNYCYNRAADEDDVLVVDVAEDRIAAVERNLARLVARLTARRVAAAAALTEISSARTARRAEWADELRRHDSRIYRQCNGWCRHVRPVQRGCRIRAPPCWVRSQSTLPSAWCRSPSRKRSHSFRLSSRDCRANRLPSHNDLGLDYDTAVAAVGIARSHEKYFDEVVATTIQLMARA